MWFWNSRLTFCAVFYEIPATTVLGSVVSVINIFKQFCQVSDPCKRTFQFKEQNGKFSTMLFSDNLKSEKSGLAFFAPFYETSASKIFGVIVSLINIVICTPILYSVIWYFNLTFNIKCLTQFYHRPLLFNKRIIVPYFIEYSAHFYTLKMMLKYSLRTIHGG